MQASTLAQNPGFADAVALEQRTLAKLRGLIDSTFADAQATVPKLVGDEVTFAESYLHTHATGYTATIIDGALAFGGNVITNAESQLDTVAKAELVSLQKTIDLHIGASA